jgi:hypothetical protein
MSLVCLGMKSDLGSIERQGAAQGLSEVLAGMDVAYGPSLPSNTVATKGLDITALCLLVVAFSARE